MDWFSPKLGQTFAAKLGQRFSAMASSALIELWRADLFVLSEVRGVEEQTRSGGDSGSDTAKLFKQVRIGTQEYAA
jgi:hypothetical protein